MTQPRKPRLSHVTSKGDARMVDVSAKKIQAREARAEALVRMSPDVLRSIRAGELAKGDALGTAKIAGIMAAKRTHELIPLCHPLAITDVGVECALVDQGVLIRTAVKTTDRTGVEMEALVAASIAALTVYDMCKSLDKGIAIEHVRLTSKRGGRSGAWNRDG